MEEVLVHQTQAIRDFLCKTAVLERMNDKLCNDLTERSDSRELLQKIEKSNLFLIPLDDKREWYRYHHLFADSIKAGLSVDEENGLNRKAAVWMKANGFSHEAVRYAFKSRDLQLAVKIVEDSCEEAFKYAQLDSLVGWMEQIPDDMIRGSEALSVRKAVAYFATGRVNDAIHYLKTLDQEFEQNASHHNKGLLFVGKSSISEG